MKQEKSKYDRATEFEALMLVMKRRAMGAAAAHKISRHLGMFGLTWATVVVLGSFAQQLHTFDLFMVCILLLVQAIRFAASSTFGRLPSANLFSEQHHPDHFKHGDDQYFWASRIHAAGQLWSFSTAVSAIAATLFRMLCGGSMSLAIYNNDKIRHAVLFLDTFYILTILTSFFAIIAVILHLTRHFPSVSTSSSQFRLVEPSTTAFYDAVYHRAIESDLYSSFGVSVLEFAFEKLRADHVRGIQSTTIEAYNRALVDYIYDVPTGMEMAYQHLQDPDMYRQLVAVNLAMFWFKKDRMERQIAYFAELGRKLERPEKLAEAASYAIERLADNWADYPPDWFRVTQQKRQKELREVHSTAVEMDELHRYLHPKGKPYPGRHPFLEAQIDRASRMTVVDMLAELVIKELRPTLVFQVRALESCCRSQEVVDWIQKKDYYVELMSELLSILNVEVKVGTKERGPRQRQRTKIYVASVRFHLERSRSPDQLREDRKERCNNNSVVLGTDEWKQVLEQIDPADTTENYVWKKETQLLDSLRQEMGLAPFDRWDKVKIKDPMDLVPKRYSPSRVVN